MCRSILVHGLSFQNGFFFGERVPKFEFLFHECHFVFVGSLPFVVRFARSFVLTGRRFLCGRRRSCSVGGSSLLERIPEFYLVGTEDIFVAIFADGRFLLVRGDLVFMRRFFFGVCVGSSQSGKGVTKFSSFLGTFFDSGVLFLIRIGSVFRGFVIFCRLLREGVEKGLFFRSSLCIRVLVFNVDEGTALPVRLHFRRQQFFVVPRGAASDATELRKVGKGRRRRGGDGRRRGRRRPTSEVTQVHVREREGLGVSPDPAGEKVTAGGDRHPAPREVCEAGERIFFGRGANGRVRGIGNGGRPACRRRPVFGSVRGILSGTGDAGVEGGDPVEPGGGQFNVLLELVEGFDDFLSSAAEDIDQSHFFGGQHLLMLVFAFVPGEFRGGGVVVHQDGDVDGFGGARAYQPRMCGRISSLDTGDVGKALLDEEKGTEVDPG
mmetsp:Transcript_5414/g.11146  ORF Transcript_5414/g.11146 Transcript_5414/m.11146 type:complete len:436 (+) Transcript_5414:552-1859(+)